MEMKLKYLPRVQASHLYLVLDTERSRLSSSFIIPLNVRTAIRRQCRWTRGIPAFFELCVRPLRFVQTVRDSATPVLRGRGDRDAGTVRTVSVVLMRE